MALWGSASLIVILIGMVVSALILLLFPLPTMLFRFGLHPWRMLVLVATLPLGCGGGERPGRLAGDPAAAAAVAGDHACNWRRTPTCWRR